MVRAKGKSRAASILPSYLSACDTIVDTSRPQGPLVVGAGGPIDHTLLVNNIKSNVKLR